MVGFLIGLSVVVGLIWLAIVSPSFRKAIGVLLVIVVVGLFLLFRGGEKEAQERQERQQQQALQELRLTNSIRASDLSLTDVTLEKGELGAWTLKGRVTNNSKFDVRQIYFLVTIKDCPVPQDCKVIGQEKTSTGGDYVEGSEMARRDLIPSGQARLFKAHAMEFRNMPPASNAQWEYKITEIRAAF